MFHQFTRRILIAAVLMASATLSSAASAANWGGMAYWGAYSPYGTQNQSLTPTPPYFALHPPVYYGSRHARPYGISPFASLPQVTASDNYKSRLQSSFVNPPQTNPYCSSCSGGGLSASMPSNQHRNGLVRNNPYATEALASVRNNEL